MTSREPENKMQRPIKSNSLSSGKRTLGARLLGESAVALALMMRPDASLACDTSACVIQANYCSMIDGSYMQVSGSIGCNASDQPRVKYKCATDWTADCLPQTSYDDNCYAWPEQICGAPPPPPPTTPPATQGPTDAPPGCTSGPPETMPPTMLATPNLTPFPGCTGDPGTSAPDPWPTPNGPGDYQYKGDGVPYAPADTTGSNVDLPPS